MAKLERYRKGAEAGDNEFTGFVNYAVSKKSEGSYRLRRILMVCGYILFALLYGFVCLVLTKAAMLIAVLPLFIWILTYFTWLYVHIEYEYTIVAGQFRLCEVYGLRRSRELCTVRLSAMYRIAPYADRYKAEADSTDITHRYYGISSLSSPDLYYGLYKNEQGEPCAVFFEATEKTLKVIKYYMSDVILSKTRY